MNIKFRVWLSNKNQYLLQYLEQMGGFCLGILLENGLESLEFDFEDRKSISAFGDLIYKFEYFTRKYDRDGKEIYENDIIRMKFCESWEEEHEEDFKVYWAEGHAGFALESLRTHECIFHLDSISHCQIVGNIHNA